MKNTWICENEKILISSPVLNIVERNCRSSEDQRQFKFFLMKSRDWCNIIPVTEDGKIVMVKQYRIGVSEHTVEVPGGVVDPEDSDIKAAAIREMEEETGYTPLPHAQCTALGWTFPNPAIMDNRCHSYVIGPVRKTTHQKLDPGEMIEIVEVPISEIPERIARGEISHALMLNTFFFLTLTHPEASKILLNQLNRFSRENPSR
jgi:8-oxo-dGTP pyrophosphatase MutT (NUDIX family)